MMKSKTGVIILAAGKGTRLALSHSTRAAARHGAGQGFPKAMVPVGSEPMVRRVLKVIEESKLGGKPVVVVGYKQQLIRQALGSRARYAYQPRQLGTAQAVVTGLPLIARNVHDVVIVYADHPFLSSATLKRLVRMRQKSEAAVAMVTIELKDFSGPRRAFWSFSRIVRDRRGKFVRDMQVQDASPTEKKILEINPCFYCFDAHWLRLHLPLLNRQNVQREYYLTDLLALAVAEQKKIVILRTQRWQEALGVNTAKDLTIANRLAGRI